MKHLSLILSALLISVSSMAQMYIWQGGRSTAANIDSITFSASAPTNNTFIVNPSVTQLQAGYMYQLDLYRNDNLAYEHFQWTSSNEGVATIDTQGRVTAIAPGMTILSATLGMRSQTCILTVFDVEELYLRSTDIAVGSTLDMQLYWSPSNCDYPMNLTWMSSDPQVATVNEYGTVTALSGGTTTITVTNQQVWASCEVSVVDVESISITPTKVTICPDDQTTLSANITPSSMQYVTCKWESDNTAVATVSPEGVVTGIAEGIANITVSAGKAKTTCKVIVLNNYEETLRFTEAYIGIDDYDSINTVAYEHSILGTLNVHICEGRVQLFTEGFYFNASGKLDGANRGGFIYITTPIAVAFANENRSNPNMAQYPNGVTFSLGSFDIDLNTDPMTSASPQWHHAQKGYVDNQQFIGYLQNWLRSYNQEGNFTEENYRDFAYAGINGFGGTQLVLREYTTDSETGESSYEAYPNWLWKYTPNGIVTGGELYISGEQGSSQHMYKIDYSNISIKFVDTDSIGIPGAYFKTENNQLVLKSTGVEFGRELTYTTGTKPAEAPAKSPKNGNISIFVDHIIPMVSDLPAMEPSHIALPKNADLPLKK